jgi:bifunctional non-homologous end joining protein LigD
MAVERTESELFPRAAICVRRANVGRAIGRAEDSAMPDFVPPQLKALTKTAPEGGEWAHELKWDGYRMHARIEGRNVRLLSLRIMTGSP